MPLSKTKEAWLTKMSCPLFWEKKRFEACSLLAAPLNFRTLPWMPLNSTLFKVKRDSPWKCKREAVEARVVDPKKDSVIYNWTLSP